LNDDDNNIQLAPNNDGGVFVVGMALIAQIALGVIVGGLILALWQQPSLSGIAAREMSVWLLHYLLPEQSL
jgi:hypothetical protein